tara:strand:- start:420 stop:1292 length:873 start_codon:yes stop_codon:yes gene_type:complete
VKNKIKNLIPLFLKKMIRKVFPKKKLVHLKNVFGFDIYQNPSDIINYEEFDGKKLEEVGSSINGRIFYCMNRYISKGSIAIDVGANIGLMTLAMSKLVGNEGRVISFEPGPVSFGLLRRNIFTNVFNGNVIISDEALSDSLGKFNLFFGKGESAAELHKNIEYYKNRNKFMVKTQTIDNYFLENKINFSQVSFVKIDVQGHDLSVMRGGRTLFSTAKKIAVLIEFAPYLKAWENQTIDDFYNEIISFNFEIYDESNLAHGKIDLNYLKSNFGAEKIGVYTDLLLLKGQNI